MSCQIIGNFVGSVLLTRYSGFTFFLLMGLMIVASALLFCCLKEPEAIEEEILEIEE